MPDFKLLPSTLIIQDNSGINLRPYLCVENVLFTVSEMFSVKISITLSLLGCRGWIILCQTTAVSADPGSPEAAGEDAVSLLQELDATATTSLNLSMSSASQQGGNHCAFLSEHRSCTTSLGKPKSRQGCPISWLFTALEALG